MPLVDLHSHSTASDGTDAPADVVRQAARQNLVALALTDHDTVDGIDEAQQAAEQAGIELVAGIEISAVRERGEGEYHVLGLLIDHRSEAIASMNAMLVEARDARNAEMLDKLEEVGAPIDRGRLAEMSQGIVSRAHMAELLVSAGHVSSFRQAFEQLIGPGGEAYVDKARLTWSEAFDTIHAAGGVAALAHPVHYEGEHPSQLETVIGRMADAGLDAIEAFHPDLSPRDTRRMMQLARRLGLCITGGSDYHGHKRMNRPLGSQHVDAEFLEKLKQRAATRPASEAEV